MRKTSWSCFVSVRYNQHQREILWRTAGLVLFQSDKNQHQRKIRGRTAGLVLIQSDTINTRGKYEEEPLVLFCFSQIQSTLARSKLWNSIFEYQLFHFFVTIWSYIWFGKSIRRHQSIWFDIWFVWNLWPANWFGIWFVYIQNPRIWFDIWFVLKICLSTVAEKQFPFSLPALPENFLNMGKNVDF